MKTLNKCLTLILLLTTITLSLSATRRPIIYKIDIKKEINKTTWFYLKGGLLEANKLHVAGICSG